jgi:hypothetical protein
MKLDEALGYKQQMVREESMKLAAEIDVFLEMNGDQLPTNVSMSLQKALQNLSAYTGYTGHEAD